MFTNLEGQGEPPCPSPPVAHLAPAPGALPVHVAAAIWRGNELGSSVTQVIPTGWDELDQELPGGGIPDTRQNGEEIASIPSRDLPEGRVRASPVPE